MTSGDVGGNRGEKTDPVGLGTVLVDTGHHLALPLEADPLGYTGEEFMGS